MYKQSAKKPISQTPVIDKTSHDTSRLQMYAVKNSITKRYQDERITPIDFSKSTNLNNSSFNTTPDKRKDLSKSTRNSSFYSANDITPNEPVYDFNLPAALQTAEPPSAPLSISPVRPALPPSIPVVDTPQQSTPKPIDPAFKSIEMRVSVFSGIGVIRRPTMEATELKNHKCKTRILEKINNTRDKLYDYYEEFGDTFLMSVLEGIQSDIDSNRESRNQKFRDQEKETKKFEKKVESERLQEKCLKKKMVVVSRENREIEKQNKKAKKAESQQKRIAKKRVHSAQADLAILENKNTKLKSTKKNVPKTTKQPRKPKNSKKSSTNTLTEVERKEIYQKQTELREKRKRANALAKKKKDKFFSSSEEDDLDSDLDIEGLIKKKQ